MSMKRSKGTSSRSSSRDDDSVTTAKARSPEKSWEELVAGKPDSAFVPYSLKTRFEKGALITHPKFGKGVALSADATTIDALFADGHRKLAHGRA